MWYIVYRQDTGALVSIGTSVATPLPDGLAAVPYEQQPDLEANTWDPGQRMLVPRVITPKAAVSRQDFMDRLGQDVVTAVEYASVERAGDSPQVGMQKAALRAWLRRFDVISEVVVTDPRTIAGVDNLIAAGLLDAAKRDAVLALPAA